MQSQLVASTGAWEAGAALTEAERLRRRTRAQRQAAWFAPALFSLLVLGSATFYWQPPMVCRGGRAACAGSAFSGPLANAVGPMETPGGLATWATLYWAGALAAGLVVAAVFFRRRAARSGVDVSTWPAVMAGAVVAAYVVLTSPVILRALSGGRSSPPTALALPDLHLRGLTPLLVLAVALGALALAEHSRALGVGAVVFAGVAVTANLYDLSNLVARLGWQLGPSAAPLANVVVPGLVLAAIATATAVGARWSWSFEVHRRG